jgi:tetrahydromethanopterin S-methyltransferase subunit B
MAVQQNMEPTIDGICWAGVTRNDTILVEAGEDNFNGQVTRAAQELLKKKPTPGYEYFSPFRSPLKGIKFHVYEQQPNGGEMFIWAFLCVYDSTIVQKDQAQSFLEKISGLTQLDRAESYRWRNGDTLAAQEPFAEILLHQMEQVTYRGRSAMVNDQVNFVKEQMGRNIDLILERGEKLEDLNEQATRLEEMSKSFKKGAKKLRRVQMWQNAKYGLVVGTAVTGVVAVIVIPPLVALL